MDILDTGNQHKLFVQYLLFRGPDGSQGYPGLKGEAGTPGSEGLPGYAVSC